MSAHLSVSLQTHLEGKIDAVQDIFQEKLDATKDSFNEKLLERDKARTLQAEEYSRRLHELNHAHALRLAQDGKYATLEKLETFQNEYRLYKESTEKALTLSAGSSGGIAKLAGLVAAGVAFLASLIWAITLLQQIAAK